MTRYVEIKKPIRLRSQLKNFPKGDVPPGTVLPLDEIGLDRYSLSILVTNRSIAEVSPPSKEKSPSIELDLPPIEPSQSELDELWDSAQVAGAKSRYCPECEQPHSSKKSLFNCDHIIDE